MNDTASNGNGNGNGKKKIFDVRDIQHWSLLMSGAQFIAICSAIWWFADMKNMWKNHCDADKRHWSITWTLPEMVNWVNNASRQSKLDLPDPYETNQRFKDMKNN
jgi:hypothetical protein